VRIHGHLIEHLPTEELLRHLRGMRAANAEGEALRVQFVLAWRLRRTIAARARRRVPAADVEEIVSQVVNAAGERLFRGQALGEFVAWLSAITRNKICDYHRARARAPQMVRLSAETDREITQQSSSPDQVGAVEMKSEVHAALATLRPARWSASGSWTLIFLLATWPPESMG
jgi:DNA-directed RNA polymerase specialized sigma24 family protein